MSNICTLLVSGIRAESKIALSVWVTVRCQRDGIPVFIEDFTCIPPCASDRDVATSLLLDFADTPEYNNCEWLLDPAWHRESLDDAAWRVRWERIAALIQAMQPHGYTLRLYMGYCDLQADDFEQVELEAAQLPAWMAQRAGSVEAVCVTLSAV